MKRHLSTALLAVLAPLALQQAHANTVAMDLPIGEIEGQPSWTARQSSDLREDTRANQALPAEFETFAVPEFSTPAYTQRQLNPWWQIDLRVRRDITTVAALPCEGYAVNTSTITTTSEDAQEVIACNSDYNLDGAWVLVSDLPLPNDPWLASLAEDPTALISRFPIISNGYTQTQLATINRSARYLRVQFPPGTHRALAIEKLGVRGTNGISETMLTLNDAHDALFQETRMLIESLSEFQGIGEFTHEEFARLHGRGRQLENAARTSASVARRIRRLEGNLNSAIGFLDKAEVIPQLRGPARTTRRTLEHLRNAARQIKEPAKRAEQRLRKAQRSFRNFNNRVRQSQGVLSASISWSASEETAVAGLYHSQSVDTNNPLIPVIQPQPEPLESYSGFRNEQIELTRLNDRTRDIGTATREFNDAVQSAEDAIDDAQNRLTQVDRQLARIETVLSSLLTPLRDINSALGQRVCIPLTSACFSVNDVLKAIQDGKNFIGLGALEDLVNGILDPIINEITRPLTAAFPSIPAFPTIGLIDLPDASALQEQLTSWEETIASLRDLLKTPSFFNMSEANTVIEDARDTDGLWETLNESAGDAPQVSP